MDGVFSNPTLPFASSGSKHGLSGNAIRDPKTEAASLQCPINGQAISFLMKRACPSRALSSSSAYRIDPGFLCPGDSFILRIINNSTFNLSPFVFVQQSHRNLVKNQFFLLFPCPHVDLLLILILFFLKNTLAKTMPGGFIWNTKMFALVSGEDPYRWRKIPISKRAPRTGQARKSLCLPMFVAVCVAIACKSYQNDTVG